MNCLCCFVHNTGIIDEMALEKFLGSDNKLLTILKDGLSTSVFSVFPGATWTTDAPFRETDIAVENAKEEGILAVEMEAAALYAFALARDKKVICFAHVTNQMGNIERDFEKGEANGTRDALKLIAAAARIWRSSRL